MSTRRREPLLSGVVIRSARPGGTSPSLGFLTHSPFSSPASSPRGSFRRGRGDDDDATALVDALLAGRDVGLLAAEHGVSDETARRARLLFYQVRHALVVRLGVAPGAFVGKLKVLWPSGGATDVGLVISPLSCSLAFPGAAESSRRRPPSVTLRADGEIEADLPRDDERARRAIEGARALLRQRRRSRRA